jgi:hypothetical protein
MIRLARTLGVLFQILVLGELLFIAFSQMVVLQAAARLFHYAEF